MILRPLQRLGWREADNRIRALVVAIPPPDVEDGDAWTLMAAGDAEGLAWAGRVARALGGNVHVQRVVAFIPDDETYRAAWEQAGWWYKAKFTRI